MEITDHPLFEGVDWTSLSTKSAPTGLHLPQFTYSEPKPSTAPGESAAAGPHPDRSDSLSQGFAFSAFFQSSSVSPGLSLLRPSPGSNPSHASSLSVSWKENPGTASSFIGFSWGPPLHAFPEEAIAELGGSTPYANLSTPRPLSHTPLHTTPVPARHSPSPNTLSVPPTWANATPMLSTPGPKYAYSTPMKPYALSPYATLPRTSTVRRTAPRRVVSDREAMKQLVECIGMSARKKILESGRKPRILSVFGSREQTGGTSAGTGRPGASGAAGRSMNYGTLRKELRFDRFTTPIPGPDYSAVSSARSRGGVAAGHSTEAFDDPSDIYYHPSREEAGRALSDGVYPSSESTDSEGGGPPSPSPSPRPGSAMSVMSMTMMSRRSATPTVSGHFSGRARSGSGASALLFGERDRSVTTTMATTTTSSGMLTIPLAHAELKGREARERLGPSSTADSGPGTQKSTAATMQSNLAKFKAFLAPDAGLTPPPPTRNPIFMPESSAPAATSGFPKTKERPSHMRRRSSPPRSARRDDDVSRDHRVRELERRHTLIMRDIEALEARLSEVTSLVAGQ